MRRNKRTQPNIFTMSALDLFASALGAFVLIAVISLPYYLNEDQTDVLISQKKEITELKKSVANAAEEKIKCEKDKEKLMSRMASIGSENETLQSTVKGLKKQLENSIKFSLLGISTKATSFTIVIDMSGSVIQYKKTIEDVVRRLIKPMVNKCQVQIIGYSGSKPNIHFSSWNNRYTLKSLDSDAYIDAVRFTQNIIKAINPKANTPTMNALEEALHYPSDAIILISDGDPTDATPNEVVEKITRLNVGKKEIHSIAIGNYLQKKKLSNFLIDLSSKNGGGFIGVASVD